MILGLLAKIEAYIDDIFVLKIEHLKVFASEFQHSHNHRLLLCNIRVRTVLSCSNFVLVITLLLYSIQYVAPSFKFLFSHILTPHFNMILLELQHRQVDSSVCAFQDLNLSPENPTLNRNLNKGVHNSVCQIKHLFKHVVLMRML